MNKVKECGQVIRSYNSRKTLIICDKEMLRSGYTHEVIKELFSKSIKYELFYNIGQEQEETELRTCMEIGERSRVDSVVSIGDKYIHEFARKYIANNDCYYPLYEIELRNGNNNMSMRIVD